MIALVSNHRRKAHMSVITQTELGTISKPRTRAQQPLHAAQLAQTLETNSPGNIILGRALALGALGRRAEALTGLDEAIAALTKEKDNAGLFRAHFGLADLLWQPGSEKSARAHAETALHLLGPIEGNTTERQVAIRKWLTEHPGGPG